MKILDHATIKGEIPVHLGTCRSTTQALINNACMQGLDVPFQGLRRRGSASSTHSARSHNSATTTYSLPPGQYNIIIVQLLTVNRSYKGICIRNLLVKRPSRTFFVEWICTYFNL